MDVFSTAERSQIMSSVKSKNTGIEIIVARILRTVTKARSIRNCKKLPGSPDLAIPRYRAAIFVHGCFWHGHKCHKGALPKSNKRFWGKKLLGNRSRDKKAYRALRAMGYKTATIWQCQLRNPTAVETRIRHFLRGQHHVD